MNKIDALGLLYKKITGKKWRKKPKTVAAAILQIQNDYTTYKELDLSNYITKEELQNSINEQIANISPVKFSVNENGVLVAIYDDGTDEITKDESE